MVVDAIDVPVISPAESPVETIELTTLFPLSTDHRTTRSDTM